jgi:hypothetical protein
MSKTITVKIRLVWPLLVQGATGVELSAKLHHLVEALSVYDLNKRH